MYAMIKANQSVRQQAGSQAVCGPTYLKRPAGTMLVVVADPLQLAAACKLPGDKLEAPPQTFTVEEHEELGHHSGEENTGGIRLKKRQMLCVVCMDFHFLTPKRDVLFSDPVLSYYFT